MLDGGWLFPGLNPVEPLTARQLNRAVHEARLAARRDPAHDRRLSEALGGTDPHHPRATHLGFGPDSPSARARYRPRRRPRKRHRPLGPVQARVLPLRAGPSRLFGRRFLEELRNLLPLTPATAAPTTVPTDPPSSVGIAAPRCSSSRPSRGLSTSADRRSLRGCHEHTMLNSAVLLVGTSSRLAGANAHGHRPPHPSFLDTSVANTRLRPNRFYTPQRRGPNIGSAIKFAGPGVFVQIPIAHRSR
jgi:hypothetical protein